MTPITRPARTSLGTALALAAEAPRVSVVIPTRNRAELIGRAIRSVLAQTMSDLELIVVDDASTDATVAAVQQFEDSRLRNVRLPENGRQSRALNEGIGRARAEWVAFLDDDDEWLPHKLEAQLARLSEAPDASAVYCRCKVMTSEGLRGPMTRSALPEGDITDALLSRRMLITPSGYVVRREALFSVGGFDEALFASQDMDLWLRLCQAGHRFVIVPGPLFIYHAEDNKQGVSTDFVAQLQAFELIDQRWGALMRERLGVEEYERWHRNRSNKLQRAKEKLQRKMERRAAREREPA
jgi:glycosyltransferase involved in cell wall biosynthesis